MAARDEEEEKKILAPIKSTRIHKEPADHHTHTRARARTHANAHRVRRKEDRANRGMLTVCTAKNEKLTLGKRVPLCNADKKKLHHTRVLLKEMLSHHHTSLIFFLLLLHIRYSHALSRWWWW